MKRPFSSAILFAVVVASAAALWGAKAFTGNRTAQARAMEPVPTDEVLAMIAAGKRVIFVDAREAQEFAEEHIPGAVNLSLSELESADPSRFADADLIVAYCMKDFRGYEVAKALRRAGFPQSTIIREYGIAGWKKQGLPTVLRGGRDEKAARDALAECARSRDACSKSKG